MTSPMRDFPSWKRREIRRELIEKYGAFCQLCLLNGKSEKQAVIRLDVVNTAKSWSVDHIVPVSRGGRNAIDNMWPSHRSCNTFRGNSYIAEEGSGNAVLKYSTSTAR